jgi:uncharacterized membrane protein YdjX (TVP38/TMEM64 family)
MKYGKIGNMKLQRRLKRVFTPRVIIVSLVVIAAIVAIFYFFGPQLLELFSDEEKVHNLVKSTGPFGPILFALLQIFQIIFAPIPGNVTGALGGVMFGWWGLPITIISTAVGVAMVAAISRRFGRPLIERFFNKKEIDKLDFMIGEKAGLALFLVFLIPLGPSDLASYLAGLTTIRLRNIVLISTIGRLPGQIVLNFFGNKALGGGSVWWIVALVSLAVIAIFFYIKRQWMQDFIAAENHWEFFKSSFQRKNNKK